MKSSALLSLVDARSVSVVREDPCWTKMLSKGACCGGVADARPCARASGASRVEAMFAGIDPHVQIEGVAWRRSRVISNIPMT